MFGFHPRHRVTAEDVYDVMVVKELDALGSCTSGQQRFELTGAAQLRPLLEEPRACRRDLEAAGQRLGKQHQRAFDADFGRSVETRDVQQFFDHLEVVGCR